MFVEHTGCSTRKEVVEQDLRRISWALGLSMRVDPTARIDEAPARVLTRAPSHTVVHKASTRCPRRLIPIDHTLIKQACDGALIHDKNVTNLQGADRMIHIIASAPVRD